MITKFSIHRPTTNLVAELQKKITGTDQEELPAFPAPSCQPIHHIYFLKTHKTGSTTLGTILLSYGVTRNHKIVLDGDLADMQWPAPLKLNEVSSLVKSEEAKIFVSHIRFNKGPVNSVFPKPEAKYITIVRHPVSQFKSAWLFFQMAKFTHIPDNTANTFLKSSDALQEMQERLKKAKRPELIFHFSNTNLYDMGLEQENIQNMTLVEGYIDKMEREFDLVMITEYFDESLILLKRLLCWEFQDIVYIKLRVKGKEINFEKEVENNILTWNRADTILYDHFNKTFWRTVREAGSTFDEELKTFRRLNQKYQETCKSTKDQKCKLSKRVSCQILNLLWKGRGMKYRGPGCRPRAKEVTQWRRGLNSTSPAHWNLAKLLSSVLHSEIEKKRTRQMRT